MLDEKYTKKKNKKTKSQFTGLRKRAIHPTDTLPSSPNFPDPSTSPQKWPPLVEKKKRSTHFSLNFLPLEKRFKRYVYIYVYICKKKKRKKSSEKLSTRSPVIFIMTRKKLSLFVQDTPDVRNFSVS